jgi:hypothetical protein
MNSAAALRPFRRNAFYIGIEVSILCYGMCISGWDRKCWRSAEFIFVTSSYPFQRTSVSCVSWHLASRGEVTSHSSLPVVLDRVLYIGYLTADTLWLLFMEKGKVCVLCGARLPAGLALRHPSPVGYHLASIHCSTVARILEHECIGIIKVQLVFKCFDL